MQNETTAKFLPHGVEVTQTNLSTGVKSTKIVDYNSFFEAVNKNIILQTGLLPLGCRYFSRHNGDVIIMLEEPPRIEEMTYHNIHGGETEYKARIPIPGILFGIRMHEGVGVSSANIWALKTPIKTIDDVIYHCPLGNTYMSRGMTYGNFCWGNTKNIWSRITEVHQMRSMINIFYTSNFNSDLPPCFNIPPDLASYKLDTILGLWKFISGKEEFPTQILIEAGTFKSAIKIMEGKE